MEILCVPLKKLTKLNYQISLIDKKIMSKKTSFIIILELLIEISSCC